MIVRLDGFAEWVTTTAADVVDRLSSGNRTPMYWSSTPVTPRTRVLDRTLTEALRNVLRFGPEVGVHTIGWWRSTARLRSLLTMSSSPDDLGALLALDVQGAELGTLAPPGLLPVWSPRPGGRSVRPGPAHPAGGRHRAVPRRRRGPPGAADAGGAHLHHPGRAVSAQPAIQRSSAANAADERLRGGCASELALTHRSSAANAADER